MTPRGETYKCQGESVCQALCRDHQDLETSQPGCAISQRPVRRERKLTNRTEQSPARCLCSAEQFRQRVWPKPGMRFALAAQSCRDRAVGKAFSENSAQCGKKQEDCRPNLAVALLS
jgi:hypothetical protein